jgi:hypothetical protein
MKPESEKLLAGLKSESADERYAAWVAAANADPEVIPEIAKLLEAPTPGVRKAADEALKKIVHSLGKPTGTPRRGRAVLALLALAAPKQPKWTRTVALRHLSLVGGDECIEPVAKMLREPEIQEEAVFCLERIPGAASDQALMAAFADVKADFKPRILAALGHRRTAAAAGLCGEAMGSSDTALAMAAMKALGRIGRNPGTRPSPPDFNSLSEWDKLQFGDSILRYADAAVGSGNQREALPLYRLVLASEEPHMQCAALIGLGKVGTPEAAELIESKRKSPIPQVRITAEKVRKKA